MGDVPDTLTLHSGGLALCHTSEDPRTHSSHSLAGVHPWDRHSWASAALVSPAVPALGAAALVEGGHGLICRARLKLHEVSTRMFALGTRLCGGVNILPGGRSPEHVVYFFQLRILPVCDQVCARVRGSPAGHPRGSGCTAGRCGRLAGGAPSGLRCMPDQRVRLDTLGAAGACQAAGQTRGRRPAEAFCPGPRSAHTAAEGTEGCGSTPSSASKRRPARGTQGATRGAERHRGPCERPEGGRGRSWSRRPAPTRRLRNQPQIGGGGRARREAPACRPLGQTRPQARAAGGRP